jgi:nitrogen regulatory protein P-II 1
MKLITAIIRPNMLDKLTVALENVPNFPGMTVSDAEGFGQRLRTTVYDSLNPFKPKKRIEIAVNDDVVDEIVKVIRQHAHTGKKGDGIIFVMPIDEAVLI